MKRKDLNNFLIIGVIAIFFVLGIMFIKASLYVPDQNSPDTVTAIQKPSDLKTASGNLDSTDLDNIDSSLDQLDKEVDSSF